MTLLHQIVFLISLLSPISLAGVISLPYAEIKEPFEAWFDLSSQSSRLDYYNGKQCGRQAFVSMFSCDSVASAAIKVAFSLNYSGSSNLFVAVN